VWRRECARRSIDREGWDEADEAGARRWKSEGRGKCEGKWEWEERGRWKGRVGGAVCWVELFLSRSGIGRRRGKVRVRVRTGCG